ncbi:hypothetical protein [Bacillus haynesii]|uniref:hypothetical protein n=1 Tax=Bacillus haynesii TaxID=1925021 RepID=UPI0022809FBE|nr:hypothetical protein [Bacillus haynesii]MCY8378422.1 hypothetical protein [Bacillus haynesii]MCY8611539.1 hypothetical protein [Bacillus haynesii]MEC0676677.1 hypothetical protein [Bacillus haynesii]
MEWIDLLKTILTSWPLATVVIVLAIRKNLRAVIENRLFSLKVGNVEITFDQLLKEATEGLKSGEIELKSNTKYGDAKNLNEKSEGKEDDIHDEMATEGIKVNKEEIKENNFINYKYRRHFANVKNLAKDSPTLALEYSWRLVRAELVEILLKYGAVDEIEQEDEGIINFLLYNDIITKDLAKALHSLKEIAALKIDIKIHYFMLLDYYDRCIHAVEQLKDIQEAPIFSYID